jgi:hypothetical protein
VVVESNEMGKVFKERKVRESEALLMPLDALLIQWFNWGFQVVCRAKNSKNCKKKINIKHCIYFYIL